MGDVIARDFTGSRHTFWMRFPAKVATKDPILVILIPVEGPDAEGGIKGFVPPWPIRHGAGKVTDCTEERSIVRASSNNPWCMQILTMLISVFQTIFEGRRFSHGAEEGS